MQIDVKSQCHPAVHPRKRSLIEKPIERSFGLATRVTGTAAVKECCEKRFKLTTQQALATPQLAAVMECCEKRFI